MKSNERNNYGTNVRNTSAQETPGEIHKVDPSRQSAYHDGYVHGRVSEHNRDVVRQEVRDNDNAARGLLLGIILTSLVGLTAGALYFMNQRNNQPVPASAPVIVPTVPTASPSPSPSPAATTRTDTTVIEREVPVSSPEPTIIERTVPVPVPVPVPSSSPNQTTIIDRETVVPAPSNSSPDINITVPNSQSNPASTTEPRGTLETPASSRSESKDSSPSRATDSKEASPDGNSGTSDENR